MPASGLLVLQVLPVTGRFVAVSREERIKAELGHEILDLIQQMSRIEVSTDCNALLSKLLCNPQFS